ncbi:hypothetical protein Fmac_009382 [Flemingia macrophylla]|uniref:Uncharacterized protein n=1 Tax=Flemingia macrophylla TaxID=520843 RepID=A0ABD1N041_9FABA
MVSFSSISFFSFVKLMPYTFLFFVVLFSKEDSTISTPSSSLPLLFFTCSIYITLTYTVSVNGRFTKNIINTYPIPQRLKREKHIQRLRY